MTDVGDGLIVEQNQRKYKARHWRLTRDVVGIVDTAIRHGLRANWVEGHPSDPYLADGEKFHVGSHHITFARNHR